MSNDETHKITVEMDITEDLANLAFRLGNPDTTFKIAIHLDPLGDWVRVAELEGDREMVACCFTTAELQSGQIGQGGIRSIILRGWCAQVLVIPETDFRRTILEKINGVGLRNFLGAVSPDA